MPPVNKKPIYVSNPNDPRIKAYSDSLRLYNSNPKPNEILRKVKGTYDKVTGISYDSFIGLKNKNKNRPINMYLLGDKTSKTTNSDGSVTLNEKGWAGEYKKPEQPYIYKKEERKKENIEPLEIKQTKLNLSKDTIVDKKPEPIVIKKLPGGSGKFAQYSNMKSQLGSMKTSRMVNAKKVQNIVPTFAEGANFVSGNEKHRVYKKTTKRGEGKIGDIMVNHPTKDKGTYDTISLTRTSNAKTIKQGIAAEKKWHADNPMKMLSGAKSVKQYRGDENLPEAKNGMKKNCGCKHTRSKYKYQEGERDIAADKLEYGDDYEKELARNFGATPVANTVAPIVAKKPILKKDTVPVKGNTVTPRRDTVSTKKKTYSRIGGEKKIYVEKSPVSVNKNKPAEYTSRVKEYINNSLGELIPQKDTTYSLDENTNKMVMHLPTKSNRMWSKKNIGYGYENLTPEEQKQVKYEQKLRQRNDLAKQIEISNSSLKYRKQYPGQKRESAKNSTAPVWKMAKNVNAFTKSIEGKSGYKYGTGALAIPEGSAIVTANGGKNKQALMAYKKGNYKLLNNIIEDMPEDRVDKAQAGIKGTKVKGKYTTTDPITKETYQEESVHGADKRFGKEMSLADAQNLYNLTDAQFEAAYGKNKKSDAYKIERGRRDAVNEGNVTYTVEGKKGKDGKPLKYASGYRSKPGEGEKKKEGDDDKDKIPTPIPPPDKGGDDDTGKRKEFVTLPTMAEIAARSSILGQGIEGVPENYLKLGRYNYASQLPQTLREIQLSEQAGKESARDIVGGDAGRYLAQAGNLSASRMKANNDAVVQDTLARQDILNKNVDLGNVESQTNRGLKDQYAMQRAANRGAYNNQLIATGQGIDTAVDASKLMRSQRDVDDVRTNLLKTGEYTMDSQGNIKKTAKGAKKLKTYKRK
jgi:hypothetical protein